MNRIIIFGTGAGCDLIKKYLMSDTTEITAYADNNKNKAGRFIGGKPVISPESIVNYQFDAILIASTYYAEIGKQLLKIGVERDKIYKVMKDKELDNNRILQNGILDYEGFFRENKGGRIRLQKRKKLNMKLTDLSFELNKIKWDGGEKIRVVFLFQVPSLWPSWESFWDACENDERLDTKTVLYNEVIKETNTIRTAREFLESNNIRYIDYDDFDLEAFRPHIMVMHMPYDSNYRPFGLYSDMLRARGIRIVYIPYGIEISDTLLSRKRNFNMNLILNAWRIYTVNKEIKKEFSLHCYKGAAGVRALGHPKFDGLYHKDRHTLPEKYNAQAKGRKIVFWKVHYPLVMKLTKWKLCTITPYENEYLEFLKNSDEYDDFFFMFSVHPKYFETSAIGNEIRKTIGLRGNVCLYTEDDYRPALLSADCVITDRSAIMVEALATQKPVLYLHNADYREPLIKPVEEVVAAYYQGTGREDMQRFIEMCRKEEDVKKDARRQVFNKFIHRFDGCAGVRIKDDMIAALAGDMS